LKTDYPICIAIPENKTDDGLEAWLHEWVEHLKLTDKSPQPIFQLFRGNKEDLILRFQQANKFLKFDPIIRICSDNPFLAPEDIKLAVKLFKERGNTIHLS